MTLFDLIVIAVFALSIGFAVVRGALREIGTLLALGLAALGGFWLIKPVQALAGAAQSFLTTALIIGAIVFVLFCALYLGLHVGVSRLKLGKVATQYDRIGGAIFGALRGFVLVGLGFLAYSYYLDEDRRPEAVSRALTLPIAKGMAATFDSFAPESTRLDAPPARPQRPRGDAAVEGYDRGERAALSEIVATATTTVPSAPGAADSAPPADEPAAPPLDEAAAAEAEDAMLDALEEALNDARDSAPGETPDTDDTGEPEADDPIADMIRDTDPQ